MFLVIGNSVDAVNKMLINTHWAKNYNKILMRLEGAIDSDPTRFASGVKIRATKIPLKTLFAGENIIAFPEPVDIPTQGIVTGSMDEENLPF